MMLGMIEEQKPNLETAKQYFLQAYTNNRYNKQAFEKLQKIAPERVGPVVLLQRERLNFRENPTDIEVVIAFASRAEKAVGQVRHRIAKPESMTYSIDGRLVMVDFKETGPKFRIHPAVGDPVMCRFAESFRDEVFENILNYVRVKGTAEKDTQGRITAINIADIEPLALKNEEPLDLSIKGGLAGTDFWQHHTVDELAAAQNVKAISNVDDLLGGWPGEVNDGFEEWISELREAELIGGDK